MKRSIPFIAAAALALSLAAGSVPAQAAPAAPVAPSSLTQARTASHTKAERLWATKFDAEKNSIRAQDYISSIVAKKGAAYVHAHKAAIVKAANKRFAHFTIYKGSVKVKFTFDKKVLVGPNEYEWYLKYRLTVRNTTDKIAYAVDMNTHSGSDFKPHKVKY